MSAFPIPFGLPWTWLCFLMVSQFAVAMGSGEEKNSLPNLVILYADDMGYGDLGIQNPDSKIPTPNLDQLAREGMRFVDAHSSSGICTPSRYALLTGRYHWRKFHDIVNSWEGSVFSNESLLLPTMLQQRGYATACIGKWHLGWNWNAIRNPDAKPEKKGNVDVWGPDAFDWAQEIPDGPCDHGFDTYFGDDVPNFPPYTWIENRKVLNPPTILYEPNPRPREGSAEGRPGPMVEGWRQDAVMPELTRRAVRWIQERQGKEQPFFLYFPFTSPHAPIVPDATFQGQSQAGDFGDYVAQSDASAGQVLKTLDACGFRENTLVIFTSDNGPETYAFERVRKFDHRSMGPWRGLKRDIWEGGHRIPMIVRWPGKIPAGAVSDGLMSQIDLFATIAEWVGFSLEVGSAEDSHSQTALMTGTGPSSRNSLVHNTFADRYAIRQGDWVLLTKPSGSHSQVPKWFSDKEGWLTNTTPGALYNLRDDPGEKQNRYEDFPDRVQTLSTLLLETQRKGEVR